MMFDEILNLLDGVQQQSNGQYLARCPSHSDKKASLSIAESNGKLLLKCHAGCSVEQICQALNISLSDLFVDPKPKRFRRKPLRRLKSGDNFSKSDKSQTKKKKQTECKLTEYAAAKGLDLDFLESLGVKQYKYKGSHGISIPYYDTEHTEVALRYRIALGGKDKFRWKTGSKTTLYGLWRLPENDDFIIICEGESDTQTLWYQGFPAIGLPGASNWRDSRDAEFFERFEKIFVCIEPDAGGEAVKKWLTKSKIKERVYPLNLGEDISSLYLKDRNAFVDTLNMFISIAEPLIIVEEKENKKLAKTAFKICKDIATNKDILTLFSEDIARNGLAGERVSAKLLYLAVTSRFFERQVSCGIKGPSSVGKSYLVRKVLDFFPDSAYYDLTGMSDKALFYLNEDFRHRFLIFAEIHGMSSEQLSYFIRSLLSEGKLKYPTVKDQESLTLEIEGPCGLIVTTTKVRLHSENETRLISLTLDDSPRQTRLILMMNANKKRKPPDLEKWKAFQTWLFFGPREVEIPYLEKLSTLVPSNILRFRRDIPLVELLIKSHALIHQKTRKIKNGTIIANLDDYSAVRQLSSTFLAESVGCSIPKTVREVVSIIGMIQKEIDGPVTTKLIADELKLDRSVINRRVNRALSDGYLVNEQTKKRQQMLLKIGEDMPDELNILPDPKELE